MTTNKPIFLPLNSDHFYSFGSGLKDTEYRLYGPRWNENTCTIGRPVTISKGYGKHDRLAGTVVSFDRKKLNELPDYDQAAVRAIYGDNPGDIACIGIDVVMGIEFRRVGR